MLKIGISTSEHGNKSYTNRSYVNAFNKKGIIPILLPVLAQVTSEYGVDTKAVRAKAIELANTLDGLVVSGGVDINPIVFSENNIRSNSPNTERDVWEIELINAFKELNKPIFGICRGMQLLGLVTEVSDVLYYAQDLPSLKDSTERHAGHDTELRNHPVHNITVQFGDKVKQTLTVNSFHHQGFVFNSTGVAMSDNAIKELSSGHDFNIIAWTPEVLEGFEIEKDKIVAVQFHPEEFNDSVFINMWLDKYFIRN